MKIHSIYTRTNDSIKLGSFSLSNGKALIFSLGTTELSDAVERYDIALRVLLPFLRIAKPQDPISFLDMDPNAYKPNLSFEELVQKHYGTAYSVLTSEQQAEAIRTLMRPSNSVDESLNRFLRVLECKKDKLEFEIPLTPEKRQAIESELLASVQRQKLKLDEVASNVLPTLTESTDRLHKIFAALNKVVERSEGNRKWIRLLTGRQPEFQQGGSLSESLKSFETSVDAFEASIRAFQLSIAEQIKRNNKNNGTLS